jgi:F1F0 ATPase subunit 2
MKMIESVSYIFALLAGVGLGVIFFGGLWWTIRKSLSSKWPAVWFLGSIPLRTMIVLVGFYFVAGGDWRKLLLGLLGFLIARLGVMRFTRGRVLPVNRLAEGTRP